MYWTPVEKYTPDKSGLYLAASPEYNCPLTMYYHTKDGWSWEDFDKQKTYEVPEITHWMELPDLPDWE